VSPGGGGGGGGAAAAASGQAGSAGSFICLGAGPSAPAALPSPTPSTPPPIPPTPPPPIPPTPHPHPPPQVPDHHGGAPQAGAGAGADGPRIHIRAVRGGGVKRGVMGAPGGSGRRPRDGSAAALTTCSLQSVRHERARLTPGASPSPPRPKGTTAAPASTSCGCTRRCPTCSRCWRATARPTRSRRRASTKGAAPAPSPSPPPRPAAAVPAPSRSSPRVGVASLSPLH
jgi:hypothetical protein